jgi:hypothetical protein
MAAGLTPKWPSSWDSDDDDEDDEDDDDDDDDEKEEGHAGKEKNLLTPSTSNNLK